MLPQNTWHSIAGLLIRALLLCSFVAAGVLVCFGQDPKPAAVKTPPVNEYNLQNWKEFTSIEGAFTLAMPGVPTEGLEETTTNDGKIVIHTYLVETAIGAYYASYSDLAVAVETPEGIRALLNAGRDRALGKDAKLLNEMDMEIEGCFAKEMVIEKTNDGLILRARVFLRKNRLYQMISATRLEFAFRTSASGNPAERTDIYERVSDRFFNSFKLIKK